MRCKLLSGIAWAAAVAVSALFPAAQAMVQSAFSRLEPSEKDIIRKLEALPEEVRLCMLAELFSVIPTAPNNFAARPAYVNLPGKKQANFEDIVLPVQDKCGWVGLWNEVHGGYLMAVGFVYADDIAKLRKLNAQQQRHAQDVLKQFGKVNVRVLDAFFTEMYCWSDRVGDATNVNSTIYGSDHRQYRWGDLYTRTDHVFWESLKPLWKGNKGLLEMQYAAQISKLRLYNCKGATETGADRLAKGVGKPGGAFDAINNGKDSAKSDGVAALLRALKSMPEPARIAVLGMLLENGDADSLEDASFTDAKGCRRSVYDELQKVRATKAAVQFLLKAGEEYTLREAAVDHHAKVVKALEKGAAMRSIRKTAQQKAYEAKAAQHEVARLDGGGEAAPQHDLEKICRMVQDEQDPLCREALVLIVTRTCTVEDLFNLMVYDDTGCARNCYDVLWDMNRWDAAMDLVLMIQSSSALQAAVAGRLADAAAAHEQQEEKRKAHIKAELKGLEAAEARRVLDKASRK